MDKLSLIRQPIEEEMNRYKSLFNEAFSHQNDLLGEMLEYVRGKHGKMMRPMLVILSAKEFGPVNDNVLHSAVTLELLHTASLSHDDVIDESNERRGAASVNALFGNKASILTGDYLLSRSLHEAALTGNVEIVDVVAKLGGTLAEGEIRQLDNLQRATASEESYFEIIRHKTAALFEACGRLGALAAKAPAEKVEICAKLGELIGICFQIRDDIFDYYDSSIIGKPTGSDMREGKLTLPVIFALKNNSNAEIDALAKKVLECKADEESINRLVEFTKTAGGIAYANSVMDKYAEKAYKLLEKFSNEDVRKALQHYVDFTIQRDR